MSDFTHRAYAAPGTDLEAEASRLATVLGTGEPHTSDFFGGDYYLWHVPGGEIKLQPNRQGLDDDEFYDVDHPEVAYVVDVAIRGADPIEPVAHSLGYVRLT